jgi:hypothetical protein
MRRRATMARYELTAARLLLMRGDGGLTTWL